MFFEIEGHKGQIFSDVDNDRDEMVNYLLINDECVAKCIQQAHQSPAVQKKQYRQTYAILQICRLVSPKRIYSVPCCSVYSIMRKGAYHCNGMFRLQVSVLMQGIFNFNCYETILKIYPNLTCTCISIVKLYVVANVIQLRSHIITLVADKELSIQYFLWIFKKF